MHFVRQPDPAVNPGWLPKPRMLWLASVALAAAILIITISLLAQLILWKAVPDFTMVWAGATIAVDHPELIYDFAEVTAAQAQFRSTSAPLPFVYPPSALPLLAPFTLLPFWPAFWVWTVASAIAFWLAARRVVSGPALLFAFASAPVVLCLFLGQTALFVGALLIGGLSNLRTKPYLAGILLGIAAAVKPQVLLLAPVALLSVRNRAAFIGLVMGWTAMVVLAVPFGPMLWLEWIQAVGGFEEVLGVYNAYLVGATPTMAAKTLGLPLIWPVQLAGGAIGVWIVWRGVRSDDVSLRVMTFVCGSLLAAPYAMRYDLAILAPVAARGLFDNSARGLVLASPLLAVNVLVTVPTLLLAGLTATETFRKLQADSQS